MRDLRLRGGRGWPEGTHLVAEVKSDSESVFFSVAQPTASETISHNRKV